MTSPTQLLKEDHRVIERLLKALSTAADRLDKGQEVDSSVFQRALGFIREFADHCHHGKEEDILYPAIEARGIPRHGGPIGVMLEEHEEGRKYVQQLAQGLESYLGGDKSAAASIVRGARGYVYILRNHIPKEDEILYPMGDEVLDAQTQAQLVEQFEQIERERIGEGRHQYYLKLVEELEAEMGVKA